jgi:hypothetical protein
MNHTKFLNVVGGVVIAASGAYLLLTILKKNKDKKTQTPISDKPQSAPQAKPSDTRFAPITLDNLKNKPYVIKDREKFLDEWAAEEGGVQSIREMYAKKPSMFSSSDLYYLRSKGILPRLDFENIKPKGIATT